MTITIEQLQLDELKVFLHKQADDAFPDLKDELRLNMLAKKWHEYAEFCTCRDDANKLVGIIAFYANNPETGVAFIPHVYVNRELRGKDIFSLMLQEITSHIRPIGFNEIKLEVANDNIRAQKAYLKQGFEKCGESNRKSIYMIKNT